MNLARMRFEKGNVAFSQDLFMTLPLYINILRIARYLLQSLTPTFLEPILNCACINLKSCKFIISCNILSKISLLEEQNI